MGAISSCCLPAPEALVTLVRSSATFTDQLSVRGQLAKAVQPEYVHQFIERVIKDVWDETTNPDGVVNLGVAENKVCIKPLQERFAKCRVEVPDVLMGYHDWAGWVELRKAFARVLEEQVFRNGETVNPERLVVSNGCTSSISMLARVLSDGEPLHGAGSWAGGHAKRIMYVGPRYTGFKIFCTGFAGVGTVEVRSRDPRSFPTKSELESKLREQPRGSVVAFLLCNPSNPSGIAYTSEELRHLVEFCRRNNLCLISDEIYAVGVWGEPRSAITLMRDADVTLWGLSKDFGCSGARCSVAYVREDRARHPKDQLLEALKTHNNLYALPNIASVVLTQVLSDRPFMESYMAICREAMREASSTVKTTLKELEIPFIGGEGAMFLWADFSEFGMGSNALFMALLDECKVFLTPCSAFSDLGGDFGETRMRICFGASKPEVLKEGLKRLEVFVKGRRRSVLSDAH